MTFSFINQHDKEQNHLKSDMEALLGTNSSDFKGFENVKKPTDIEPIVPEKAVENVIVPQALIDYAKDIVSKDIKKYSWFLKYELPFAKSKKHATDLIENEYFLHTITAEQKNEMIKLLGPSESEDQTKTVENVDESSPEVQSKEEKADQIRKPEEAPLAFTDFAQIPSYRESNKDLESLDETDKELLVARTEYTDKIAEYSRSLREKKNKFELLMKDLNVVDRRMPVLLKTKLYDEAESKYLEVLAIKTGKLREKEGDIAVADLLVSEAEKITDSFKSTFSERERGELSKGLDTFNRALPEDYGFAEDVLRGRISGMIKNKEKQAVPAFEGFRVSKEQLTPVTEKLSIENQVKEIESATVISIPENPQDKRVISQSNFEWVDENKEKRVIKVEIVREKVKDDTDKFLVLLDSQIVASGEVTKNGIDSKTLKLIPINHGHKEKKRWWQGEAPAETAFKEALNRALNDINKATK